VGEGWQEGEEEAVGSRVVGGERRKRWVRKKMIKGCRCGLSWAVLMVVGLNWANVLVCIIIVTTVIHRTPLVLGNGNAPAQTSDGEKNRTLSQPPTNFASDVWMVIATCSPQARNMLATSS
jgi:hypothetical protein